MNKMMKKNLKILKKIINNKLFKRMKFKLIKKPNKIIKIKMKKIQKLRLQNKLLNKI